MQDQLRAITLPGDPPPILNPRPEGFINAETNYRTTASSFVDAKTGIPVPNGDNLITMNDDDRVTQQTGFANGSNNERPGTDPNAPGDNDPGLPYNNTTVPETGPI